MRQRETIMAHVLASAGAAPLSQITAGIREGVDRRAKTPFQAKNFVQTMRQLFQWSKEVIVSVNPCDGVNVEKPKTRGFPEWTYEEILQHERKWSLGTRHRGSTFTCTPACAVVMRPVSASSMFQMG